MFITYFEIYLIISPFDINLDSFALEYLN